MTVSELMELLPVEVTVDGKVRMTVTGEGDENEGAAAGIHKGVHEEEEG